MEVITRKLHEAVKEIEPTQDEWMQAILFLTRTGQMCNEWRQEFILLSDIARRLDAGRRDQQPQAVGRLRERRCSGRSTSPTRRACRWAPISASTARARTLVIHGRVLDTEGKPIAGAMLDVWQANDEGFYDVQQKGIQPDFNLRGVFRTGADGSYWFRAVKPKFYPIPDDGPVGQDAGALGRHPTARRISTSSSAPTASSRSPRTSSIPTIPTCNRRGVRREGKPDRRIPAGRRPGRDRARQVSADPYWETVCDFVLAKG